MHFMSYTCVLISFEEETEINVPMDALTGGQENWEVGRFTPPSTAALTWLAKINNVELEFWIIKQENIIIFTIMKLFFHII